MRIPTLALAILGGLALTGCVRGTLLRSAPPDAKSVRVAVVQAGRIPEVLTFTGLLRATRRATVSAGTAGVVRRVGVRTGERVTREQPVVWLDDAEAAVRVREQEAAVAVARARVPELETQVRHSEDKVRGGIRQATEDLAQARINVQSGRTKLASDLRDKARMEALFAEKAVPRHQVEQAQLTYQLSRDQVAVAQSKERRAEEALQVAQAGWHETAALRAQLEGARASLKQAEATLAASRVAQSETVLRAPIDGVVVDRSVEPGQSVGGGGVALLTVVDNSCLECVSTVEQRYAARLRRGMRANLRSGLEPGTTLEGTVSEVVPAGDPKTMTVQVRFTVQNRTQVLMDGVSANGRTTLQEHAGVLLPRPALRRDGRQRWVLVTHNGLVARSDVQVGYEDETWYVVTRGLTPGEVVITEAGELAPGAAVRYEAPGSGR